jgi:glucokinase
MTAPASPLSLVADIGGTNTRVALAEGRRLLPGTIRRYANADFSGLEPVLRRFIADEAASFGAVRAACVAVAGPVRDGRATMTNLDWTMDLDTLSRATGAGLVDILNDLQAQGHALGHLEAGSIRTILPFPEAPHDTTRLVIGVGTGFNIAPVHITGRHRLVPAAEAGHVNLPLRSEEDARLSAFITAAQGFASVEDVLSGRGLERVYAWSTHEAGSPRTASAAEIVAAAGAGTDAEARRAVAVFSRVLGTVAGNLALTCLPFGGIFLVGGVARAVAPFLTEAGFAAAFADKGRFAGFMAGFGLGVIEDDYAALTGCAAHIAAHLSAEQD